MLLHQLQIQWKCITLANGGSIVGCLREDQRLLFLCLFFLWNHQYRQTSKSSPRRRVNHLASKIIQRSSAISIWRTLSAAVRFASFSGLLCSRILVYHACLLLDNMSTFQVQSCRGYIPRKTVDGHTHTPTYVRTDRPTAITLAAHARRWGLTRMGPSCSQKCPAFVWSASIGFFGGFYVPVS